VDYEEWNTNHNPYVKHPFGLAGAGDGEVAVWSPPHFEGKFANKLELQAELGLPQDAHVPLFANITRLADQKGVDIQLGALEEMLAANLQFVLLGNGNAYYENAYRNLGRRFPKKVAVRIGFDSALSHRIEAGADFYLMPSRYEPCGLNQMYSLRYGAIPIVRITGGLDDSVIDIAEDQENANGIKFTEYSVRALAKAIRKALVLYQTPELLEHYRANALRADFSWQRTAKNYVEVYDRIIRKPR